MSFDGVITEKDRMPSSKMPIRSDINHKKQIHTELLQKLGMDKKKLISLNIREKF